MTDVQQIAGDVLSLAREHIEDPADERIDILRRRIGGAMIGSALVVLLATLLGLASGCPCLLATG